MTTEHVDVLVVGLGPAGTRAAAAAAGAGCSVLAVDKRRRVGEPPQCAGLVPAPLAGLAAAPARLQWLAGMETELPSGAVATAAMPGLMVDRAAFDLGLAAHAEAAGARLRAATRLTRLEPDRRRAHLTGWEGGHVVDYGLLVAADGARSTVATVLGLPALAALRTRQYTVPLMQDSTRAWFRFGADLPGGYAWCFPRGGTAVIGVGVAGIGPKPVLEALHRRLAAEGVVGERITAVTGGPVPVAGARAPVHGRILFAGDAAGLTHPVTGAGIAPAVQSGEAAGTAAAAFLAGDGAALDRYAEELAELFGPGLERALARRAELWRGGVPDDGAVRRGWVAFPEYYADG